MSRIMDICVPAVRLRPQTRKQDRNASKKVQHIREQQSYTGRTILRWILQQAVQMENVSMVNVNSWRNAKLESRMQISLCQEYGLSCNAIDYR